MGDQAESLKLADERGWETLLFLRERLFGGKTSMVDTPAFFLASETNWTPAAELQATIAAMTTPLAPGAQPDTQVVCRLPARFRWLSEHLPGFGAAVGKVDCPAFDTWRARLNTDGVSLVFSSYFADNPSSMFGHSFLRLHKRSEKGKVVSDFLDDTFNFMAYPTTDNPVYYVIDGLFGRFPGRFSMAAFYMKIQEYNNSDRRDLWEYRLAFDHDDLDRLQRVLWEMEPTAINYFYFDENCSLILLTVLEAAKPTLHLPPLHPWVIPSDSLRAVMRSPGLVSQVSFHDFQ